MSFFLAHPTVDTARAMDFPDGSPARVCLEVTLDEAYDVDDEERGSMRRDNAAEEYANVQRAILNLTAAKQALLTAIDEKAHA